MQSAGKKPNMSITEGGRPFTLPCLPKSTHGPPTPTPAPPHPRVRLTNPNTHTHSILRAGHYDTLLEILNLAKTPAGGPSVPAFLQRVDTLGFYLEDDAVLRIDPLGEALNTHLL